MHDPQRRHHSIRFGRDLAIARSSGAAGPRRIPRRYRSLPRSGAFGPTEPGRQRCHIAPEEWLCNLTPMATITPGAPASTVQRVIQQRSGRVIALSRALLASFFTLAIALDPTQSDAWVEPALLLLSAYTLFSTLIFALTWRNWWLEARLAVPAHVVDLLVFAVLIALTEGYVSPFFTFFVFLVLSSTIRGGWREATLTTAIVILLFVAAGVVAASSGPHGVDLRRLVVRGAHLPVLSFMIVWFGISQLGARHGRVAMRVNPTMEQNGPPVREALEHAVRRLAAGRIVLAWSDSEEPWLHVDSLYSGTLALSKFGPDEFPPLVADAFADRPFLFNVPRHRALIAHSGRAHPKADCDAIDPAFAARFDIDTGLATPITTSAQVGWLFAMEVPGLSADDLRVAVTVGDEVSSAFESSILETATRDNAAAHARLMLARDLHDSVVQFLAGMALQLESLKRQSGDKLAVADEIDALQQQLAAEQRDLRRLIGESKQSKRAADDTGLSDALRAVRTRLEQQWGIELALSLDESLADVPVRIHHDVAQLIREAVANAARHGCATYVTVTAAPIDGALRLEITDDGEGFPAEGEFTDAALRDSGVGPRSLVDRVHLLGGSITLTTGRMFGSRLAITLPLEDSSR